jgi:pSer/pThr/pTyr-binding forkhead associated (FHA) protein
MTSAGLGAGHQVPYGALQCARGRRDLPVRSIHGRREDAAAAARRPGAARVPLNPGINVLGRAPDAAVWIDAPGVSRHHARISLDGAAATLEDLGSKNGTYLRGEKVTRQSPLNDGDQIRLGSVLVTFRIPPPAGSTETVSS